MILFRYTNINSPFQVMQNQPLFIEKLTLSDIFGRIFVGPVDKNFFFYFSKVWRIFPFQWSVLQASLIAKGSIKTRQKRQKPWPVSDAHTSQVCIKMHNLQLTHSLLKLMKSQVMSEFLQPGTNQNELIYTKIYTRQVKSEKLLKVLTSKT